jgi:Tfp pilus assembly protein PilW
MKNLIMLLLAFTIFVIVIVAATQVYLSKTSEYSRASNKSAASSLTNGP